jgi:hypothetical protein
MMTAMKSILLSKMTFDVFKSFKKIARCTRARHHKMTDGGATPIHVKPHQQWTLRRKK